MATEPSRRPRDDLSPDGIARRSFSTSFRGFDQLEVRGFLNAVAGELASLLDRQEQLRHELEETKARLAAAEEADVHRLTTVLGEETARVLEAAREAAAQIRAKAEESAATMLQEATDDAARMRAEADAVLAQRTEEADAEAARIRTAAEEIRAAAAAAADGEIEAARQRGREMVGEAQVVRERVLRDLARRRKLARQQLEQLRAGRDRLLAAYQVVRRTLDEATGELSMAMVEAKAAAESAGRRAAEAEEPTQEELEAELAVLRSVPPAREPEPVAVAAAPAAAPEAAPGAVRRFGDDEPGGGERPGAVLRFGDDVAEPPAVTLPPVAGPPPLAPVGRRRFRRRGETEAPPDLPDEPGWQPVEGGAPFEGIRVIAPEPSDPADVRVSGATPAADLAPPPDGAATSTAPTDRSPEPAPSTEARAPSPAEPADPAVEPRSPAPAVPANAAEPSTEARAPSAAGSVDAPDRSTADAPATPDAPAASAPDAPAASAPGGTASTTEPPPADLPTEQPVEPGPTAPSTEPPGAPTRPGTEPDEPSPAVPPTEPVPDEPPTEPLPTEPPTEPVPPRPEPVAPEPAPPDEPPPAPVAEDRPRPSVEELFARIKASRADAVARAEAVLAPPDEPAAGAGPTAEPAPEAEAAADADAEPEPGPEPAAAALLRRRDEAVAGPERSLARKVKRSLSDEQNAVLDTLRRRRGQVALDELLGPPDDHRRRLAVLVTPDLLAAAAAGAATSGDASRDLHPAVDPVAVDLAAALVDPLRDRIERAVSEGGGDDDSVAERLRACYREWKTQRIPDVTRHATAAAYAAGLVAAVPPGTPLCWLVDTGGAPCPDAEDNALAGAVPAGEPFPTGHTVPPAHPGCRCLAVREDAVRPR
ncbi:MAG TPA: DivIVA domain-containing protein [Acidimicrobiales bacterium]